MCKHQVVEEMADDNQYNGDSLPSPKTVMTAVLGGDIETLEKYEEYAMGRKYLMAYGASAGQIEVVKWFKKRGVNNYDVAMEESSFGGYIEIVKLCREWGSRNFSYSMGRAAAGNHIDLVELFIEWDTENWIYAEKAAAKGNHSEILKLLHSKGVKRFRERNDYSC